MRAQTLGLVGAVRAGFQEEVVSDLGLGASVGLTGWRPLGAGHCIDCPGGDDIVALGDIVVGTVGARRPLTSRSSHLGSRPISGVQHWVLLCGGVNWGWFSQTAPNGQETCKRHWTQFTCVGRSGWGPSHPLGVSVPSRPGGCLAGSPEQPGGLRVGKAAAPARPGLSGWGSGLAQDVALGPVCAPAVLGVRGWRAVCVLVTLTW